MWSLPYTNLKISQRSQRSLEKGENGMGVFSGMSLLGTLSKARGSFKKKWSRKNIDLTVMIDGVWSSIVF